MSDEQTTQDEHRLSYIAGLHQLAIVLEQNPKLSLPSTEFFQYTWDKDKIQSFPRLIGGRVEKEYSDYEATVYKLFGPIKYGLRIARENVCERKVVGKRFVPATEAYMIPAQPAHEEDVIEWDCKPITTTTESTELADLTGTTPMTEDAQV